MLLPLLVVLVLAPGAAAVQVPTLPSVTTPAVSVPPVVPTTPIVTPPVTTPVVTTPVATVPSVTVLPAPPTPPTQPSPVTSRTETTTPSAAPAATPARHSVPVVRPAASRSLRRPLTAAHFRLAHGGTMRVSVWQERPACRFFGRYTVTANRGENALHLPRRVGRHAIVAGTYRLLGVAGARTVVDLRVRVVRRNGRLRVHRTTLASACARQAEHAILFGAAASVAPTSAPNSAKGGHTSQTAGGSRTAAAPPAGHPFTPPRLVVQVVHAVRRTLLYVLLALAIALLAGAALPRASASGVTGATLARHRGALTSAGLALIAATVLAVFLR